MKKNLDILIGLSPDSNLSINEELEFIKIGLLYGDNITLVSPKSLMFLGVSSVLGMNENQTYRYFIDLIKEIEKDEYTKNRYELFYDQYINIKKKKHKNTQEILMVKQFEVQFNLVIEEYKNKIVEIFGEDEILQFISAINSNRLIIDTLDVEKNQDFFSDRLIEEFFNKVSDCVVDGNKYPIYNKCTIDLLRFAVNEGKINIPQYSNNNIKNASFASDLIMRLPVFEGASVDEIIDIRKELDKHVNNFRGAVVDYTEKIKSEPWTREFENDAYNLFLKEVNPKVMAIEEETKANKLLYKMLDKNLKNPISVGTPMLGAIISPISNFVNLSTTAMITGASITGTSLLAYKEWKDKLSQIEQNQLFFYYKSGKIISK